MPEFRNTSIQVVRIDDPSSYALITTPIDLECFKYLTVPAPAKPLPPSSEKKPQPPVSAKVMKTEVFPVVTIVPQSQPKKPPPVLYISHITGITCPHVPTEDKKVGSDPVAPCQVFSFHLNEQSISQQKAPDKAAVAEPPPSLVPVLKEFSFRFCSMLIKADGKMIRDIIPLYSLSAKEPVGQSGARGRN